MYCIISKKKKIEDKKERNERKQRQKLETYINENVKKENMKKVLLHPRSLVWNHAIRNSLIREFAQLIITRTKSSDRLKSI
uniref:Uncharacterized protein n=1 Tax=Romanomermis culicivorax TaxID=13658 RepID=A0A915L924_ROMCU